MNKLLLAAIVAGITQAESAGSSTELNHMPPGFFIAGPDDT